MSDTEKDWIAIAGQWRDAECVYGSAVGAVWRVHPLHALCEQFVADHPDAADFLVAKLSDPDAYVVAYTFKCLVRLRDLAPDDIPACVLERREVLNVHQSGCRPRRQRLGNFLLGYWDLEGDDAELAGDSADTPNRSPYRPGRLPP